MFDNILVGVDGSSYSNHALTYACELAEKFGGKITLIHVYSAVVPLTTSLNALSPTMSQLPPPTSAPMAATITEEAKERGKSILDEAERLVNEHGLSAEKALREGDAVNEIVALAKERKIDVIVLGHRGWSKIRELLVGGVSEGVCHKAPCSVLIVK
jgi:nucleotide-binding universal stress UspA family protein